MPPPERCVGAIPLRHGAELGCCDVAPLLLLNRADEATGDIPFCRGLDQRVPILLTVAEFLFQLSDASIEADQNLFSFLVDVGELSVGEVREIGNEDFAMVPEGQKGWPWALPVVAIGSCIDGTLWRRRASRGTSASGPLGSIKWHRK